MNNGTACGQTSAMRARKSKNEHNELLEGTPHQPLDTRAPSSTGRADPVMVTAGKTHRAEDSQG
ncbi:MAG TPA: hypothetical protein VKB96_00845 [Gammaproteobacteria bacterium]|nr:hypothetical protein [Gammaproteobacteria bacterium]